MNTAQTDKPAEQKPLRLWPGVLAVVLQWLAWFVLPIFVPEATLYGVLAGVFGGGLAVLLWWLFFSRAPWSERVGAIVLMPVAVYATSHIVHASIANGMMGMMLPIFAIPVLCLALVCWAVASRRLSSGLRRAAMVATILLACGVFTLLRTGGMTGDGASDLHWRWAQTPEERLLALAGNEPAAPPSTPTAAKTVANWPGFRGPDRDGIVRGEQIATDWSRSPPVELWRRPIGPGWSSFAVRGDLLYTQEQRGDDEVVACYNLTTGQPVWKHHDATRFWESNAGAGPRATPTLSNGHVYALGATGIVNALDAADGAVVWSRNAASDNGVKIPGWGFAGSPLVVDDVVIVATSGRLVAYDLATGDLRWLGPAGGGGYSSPHLVTIDGVKQILLLNGDGAISVAPASGTQLWTYLWDSDGIVQPALTADGDVLIGTGSGMGGAGTGVRRIAVTHGPDGWAALERWTSAGLKPYFNDFVVHKDHAFGFDGSLLACIDLVDGKRKWKGGRYGHGQLILLPDQDLLLVLSEKGELALVAASPDQFRELARFPAIEGKTWNHPVLVGDVLLARNGQEMVAFRLPLAGR
ncbi:MAG TPA: PQQ-binding-like beta-propeller repeat protein [Gemmataceae bacterium]|nr:PQQ-binding-like beta-propeller repeat protein [Gemmataceae bacterium]